jgi:L-2-hydroxyglutarate oxidase
MLDCDVAVVGGGIVGLSTAAALQAAGPPLRVVVLEAEPEVAAHQTGHNSGVIHSGLYYAPGSLKARTCARGRELLYAFCAADGLPHRRCGKLVVATARAELAALAELERRGRDNGLAGPRPLDEAGIRQREPHAAGIAGLWIEETGVVDFAAVARALAARVQRAGEVRTRARLTAVRRLPDGLRLEAGGDSLRCRHLVNCAGLESDRVARRCGVDPPLRVVPFRGRYFDLTAERAPLVRGLLYPVPDPRFPFLGVHLTRSLDGRVHAGPNAFLSLRRGGYRAFNFSWRDAASIFSYPGFWRLAGRFWRTGARELGRSLGRGAFARELRRLVPEITAADLAPGGSGVRAQAVDREGRLVDDFVIRDAPRMTHVLNAPSPAATAGLAIGETIAERVRRALE